MVDEEKTALNDQSNMDWREVQKDDRYANGMSAEDARRYLESTPRLPVLPTR